MSESPQTEPSPNLDTSPRSRPRSSFFFPLLLIAVGIILLLNTTGMLPWFAWWRLWVLWPALLILIGVDIILRRAPALLRLLAALVVIVLMVGAAYLVIQPGNEPAHLTQRAFATEDVRQGDVQIDMGVGQLTVEPLGDSPNWAEMDLTGPVQEPIVSQLDDARKLQISQGMWTTGWFEDSRWDIQLNPRVPTAIKAHVGVGQCTLNLTRMNVTSLAVDTGVGQCTVNLASGESGTISVTIDGGIGSIHVVVPEGVAAQVRLNPGLGGVNVDTQRFPEVGDNLYRSANYGTATYRLDVTIDLGIGAIEVR